MQFRGAALNLIGEDVLDVRPVDEAVGHHLLDGVGLAQELKHCGMPAMDHRVEGIEHFEEPFATLDDPLVMERDVVVGVLIAHLDQ